MIASSHYFSPDEYLQLEAESAVKHEYIDGEVYAMADANDAHVTIAGNLFALLRNHVCGTSCRADISIRKLALMLETAFIIPT